MNLAKKKKKRRVGVSKKSEMLQGYSRTIISMIQ